MLKRIILILALVMVLATSAHPTLAAGVPGSIYVDTNYTGSEEGTQDKPYNTIEEARAIAKNLPGGAWIYLKQGETWSRIEYVRPVVSGATGIPLADAAIYALLAIVALALILAGWQLRRRARQLEV